MKVTITGATGNVGVALLDRLAANPTIEEIVGVARRRPHRSWPKTRFFMADVTTDDLSRAFDGADAVVHLAWLFQPTHQPLVTWGANAIGSRRVFDAAATAGVGTLVYASSVGAYSPPPADDHPVDESWPTDSTPTAAYGREKAYVERALDAFEAAHDDVRVVRFRPGFIFQSASAAEQRRLFLGPFVPGKLVRPGVLPVLPLPSGLRFQALHAADAAAAYEAALVRDDPRGAYNLAADPIVDADVLAEVFETRTAPVSRRLARGVLSAAWHARLTPAAPTLLDLVLRLPTLDTTRARNHLEWQPRFSAIDALRALQAGMASGAGAATDPLAPDSPMNRLHEVTTGLGGNP